MEFSKKKPGVQAKGSREKKIRAIKQPCRNSARVAAEVDYNSPTTTPTLEQAHLLLWLASLIASTPEGAASEGEETTPMILQSSSSNNHSSFTGRLVRSLLKHLEAVVALEENEQSGAKICEEGAGHPLLSGFKLHDNNHEALALHLLTKISLAKTPLSSEGGGLFSF